MFNFVELYRINVSESESENQNTAQQKWIYDFGLITGNFWFQRYVSRWFVVVFKVNDMHIEDMD